MNINLHVSKYHVYQFKCKQTEVKFLLLYSNTWNHLTVRKQTINS